MVQYFISLTSKSHLFVYLRSVIHTINVLEMRTKNNSLFICKCIFFRIAFCFNGNDGGSFEGNFIFGKKVNIFCKLV